MYFGSQEYIDTVFEQGYEYAKSLRPDASMITHLHMAEMFARMAEKKQKNFYEGRSKHKPHQGKKEITKRVEKLYA